MAAPAMSSENAPEVRPRNLRPRLLVIAALLALGGQVAFEVAALSMGDPGREGASRILLRYAGAAVAFVAGALVVRALPVRTSVALSLAGGALLQVIAVGYSPTTTDDFWRYLWDGKVQAAGINPYRYTPLDPALLALREAELFPPDTRTPEQAASAVAEKRTDPCTSRGVPHDCTLINRPNVNTIYPPVAEAAFLGLHHLSPADHRVRSLQIALALVALAVALALMWARHRAGRDPRAAVWWTWCPVVWLEASNNAHIDVLAVLLVVTTFGVLAGAGGDPSRRRLAAAGALFGGAVAVKFVPVLIAPALLIRRGHLLLGAAAALFALSYLPHVLAVGSDVLGYLPGYLDEEGYSGAQRFGLVRLVVPDQLAPAAVVVIGAGLAALVWRQGCSHVSAPDALLLTGTAFLLVGPSQPWYAVLLVALVALADRPQWLAVAAAGYPVYQAGHLGVDNALMQQWAYGSAAVLVVLFAWARRSGAVEHPERSEAL
ncbi:MAG: glycosyltransferase 87 family protein [Sporichthyaceae bacterium]